jgi:hypothetical protein
MTRQTQQPKSPDPRRNRLLARLEPEDYEALRLGAKVASLKFRKRLLRQDEGVNAVYFPLTAMISLLVTTDSQPQMEMATIGKEGVVGAAELLQAQGAMGLKLIQIPGSAVRIDADIFRKVVKRRPPVERLIQQYLYALTVVLIDSSNRTGPARPSRRIRGTKRQQ